MCYDQNRIYKNFPNRLGEITSIPPGYPIQQPIGYISPGLNINRELTHYQNVDAKNGSHINHHDSQITQLPQPSLASSISLSEISYKRTSIRIFIEELFTNTQAS